MGQNATQFVVLGQLKSALAPSPFPVLFVKDIGCKNTSDYMALKCAARDLVIVQSSLSTEQTESKKKKNMAVLSRA